MVHVLGSVLRRATGSFVALAVRILAPVGRWAADGQALFSVQPQRLTADVTQGTFAESGHPDFGHAACGRANKAATCGKTPTARSRRSRLTERIVAGREADEVEQSGSASGRARQVRAILDPGQAIRREIHHRGVE
ncbi:hypothetical protein ACQPZF_17135 [Actinosynnema sp. CS-041913]|uniref:hypothetical protein n=1 Tax=Actinosynnema sp. CS-041913 TaxID=3239917 RepID=UPI003D8B58F8